MSTTILSAVLFGTLLVGFALLIWSLPTPARKMGSAYYQAWRRKQRFGFVGLSLVILGVMGQLIFMLQVL